MYDDYVDCYYSFYAPGARRIRIYFYDFETEHIFDKLYMYFGLGKGAYSEYFWGDGVGNNHEFNTDFLYLYWTTDCCKNDPGFRGYVERLD